MNLSIFLLAAATTVAILGPSQPNSPSPDAQPLSASVICENPLTDAFMFEGTIEVFRGPPDEPSSASAVVHDGGGGAYEAQSFGLTGEITAVVPGHEPATLRLELGKALDRDPLVEGFVQCSFSEVVTDSRSLTPEDAAELGMSPDLTGAAAEVTTSIHGVAWISLDRP